jgi:hypothetical protein
MHDRNRVSRGLEEGEDGVEGGIRSFQGRDSPEELAHLRTTEEVE